MDKLTEDKAKFVRARVLTHMLRSDDSSRICYNNFTTCWTSKAKFDLSCYSTKAGRGYSEVKEA